MADVTTIEQRLTALEGGVRALRQDMSHLRPPQSGHEALDRLRFIAPRHAAADRIERAKAVLRAMGIEGEPIGAEALQRLMVSEGVDPQSNEFSRGIVEMREE